LIFAITVGVNVAAITIARPTAADVWYINAPLNSSGTGIDRNYNQIEYSGYQADGMFVISLFCTYTPDILGRTLHMTSGSPPYYSNADLRSRVTQPCSCRVRISEYSASNLDGVNPVWSPYVQVGYLSGAAARRAPSVVVPVTAPNAANRYSLTGAVLSSDPEVQPAGPAVVIAVDSQGRRGAHIVTYPSIDGCRGPAASDHERQRAFTRRGR